MPRNTLAGGLPARDLKRPARKPYSRPITACHPHFPTFSQEPPLYASIFAIQPILRLNGWKIRHFAVAEMRNASRPVSRVLSWTVIHLEVPSPTPSSGLPEPGAGHANGFLFGLAPSGVYLAAERCRQRGALLPHPFTLAGADTEAPALRRSTLCCTFRGLTPPRRYLALCPLEPGLSSAAKARQRLFSRLAALFYCAV